MVDAMISNTIQGLTGRSNDSQAWDALFKYFNKSRGLSVPDVTKAVIHSMRLRPAHKAKQI